MISGEKFIEYLKSGEIPPEPPEGSSIGGCDWSIGKYSEKDWRGEATSRGMWAIVEKSWVSCLAEWIGNRSCVEVMAGAGWLAKALANAGIDVVANDNGEWDERHSKMIFVHNVEKLDGVEAAKKYADREILIISWPPYGDMAICDICENWTFPKTIIYIGEGEGGCNAPDEFWNRFHTIKNYPDIPLMAWNRIHDHVFIGTFR